MAAALWRSADFAGRSERVKLYAVRAPFFTGSLVVFLFGVAPLAHAEETNPDVQACAGKAKGDACQRTLVTKPEGGPVERKKVPGVCADDNCCELDYSKGSPPETVCAPCLACKEGPGAAVDPSAGDAKSDGSAPAADADGAAAPAGNGAPPATEPSKRGGCSAGAPPLSLAWLLLTALALPRRRPGRGRS